jgi:hypothetical protein
MQSLTNLNICSLNQDQQNCICFNILSERCAGNKKLVCPEQLETVLYTLYV